MRLAPTWWTGGVLNDAAEVTRAALALAAHRADVILSSGGVSVGEEDHVREAVRGLGEIALWRVAVKPGKPLALGQTGTSRGVSAGASDAGHGWQAARAGVPRSGLGHPDLRRLGAGTRQDRGGAGHQVWRCRALHSFFRALPLTSRCRCIHSIRHRAFRYQTVTLSDRRYYRAVIRPALMRGFCPVSRARNGGTKIA